MMKLKTFLSSVQLEEIIQQDPVGDPTSFRQSLTNWQTCVVDHFYPGQQKALFRTQLLHLAVDPRHCRPGPQQLMAQQPTPACLLFKNKQCSRLCRVHQTVA